MIRKIIRSGSFVLSLIGTIFLFIFGEGWLIASIYYFGQVKSFLIFDIIFTLLSFWIISIYYRKEESGTMVVKKIRAWIKNKENNFSKRRLKLLQYGKLMGVIISGITIGPLPTSIFIGFLGYEKKQTYLLSGLVNILFFLLWTTIYSGGIKLAHFIIKI